MRWRTVRRASSIVVFSPTERIGLDETAPPPRECVGIRSLFTDPVGNVPEIQDVRTPEVSAKSAMRVFVTGATGYIGGSVALTLISRGHRVRGLVRDDRAAKALEAIGIEPVLGSLDDDDRLIAEAARADAVVNAASSDHHGSVEVLLDALVGSGKAFVHTSGSSIVGQAEGGEYSESIWDEGIMAPGSNWTPHSAKAARVRIDRGVSSAAAREVRSVVMCNSLIYGRGLGLRQDSLQVPALIGYALRHGYAPQIGAGANVWSTVHIADLCSLYARAVEDQAAQGFYFVENGEASFHAMAQAISNRFNLSGVRTLSPEEAAKEWPPNMAAFSLGSNSRVRGVRARGELGWRPVHQGVLQWIGCC